MSKLKFRTKLINYLDDKRREKLSCFSYKNTDATILCNICVGGEIYHDLNLRFMSPTINIAFSTRGFANFVLKIHDYVQKSIFVENKDLEKIYGCPVGTLIGSEIEPVDLMFRHDHDIEYCKRKWLERCSRINFDKIYVLAYCCTRPNKKYPWLYASESDLALFKKIPFKKFIYLDDLKLASILGFRYSKYLDKKPKKSITGRTPFNIFGRYGFLSCAYDEFDFAKEIFKASKNNS